MPGHEPCTRRRGFSGLSRLLLLVTLAAAGLLAAPGAALADLSSALDNPFLAFSTGGDRDWADIDGEGRPGGDADRAQSGTLPDLDPELPLYWMTSALATQITGPGEISFWWKISSAWSHELDVRLGDDRFPTWIPQSGEQDWLRFTGDVPAGTHVITWLYTKDNLFPGSGADAAWVDDVQYMPDDRPAGSMTVNDGAAYALETAASVRNSVTGAAMMRFAATGGGVPAAEDWSPWVSYQETHGVTLPWGDGSRRVYGEYRNGYGAVLALHDDIGLDLTAPLITSLSSPTHPSPDVPVADDDPGFAWTAADASGIAGFSCDLDTDWSHGPDDVLEGTGSSFSYTDVPEGTLRFHLRVRDNAGRWSETSDLGIWVASSTGPSILSLTSASHPDELPWWPVSFVDVSWQSSAPGVTEGYSWVFDETPGTVPDTVLDTVDQSVNLQGQADGLHYFHVRACGLGGVWGPAAHRQIRSDAATPAVFDLTSSSHPDPGVWYAQSSAAFAWNASGGPSGLEYSWGLDQSSGGEPDTSIDGVAASASIAGIGDGRWYFHVRARSGAGLWSATSTREILVDTGPPAISGLTCSPHAAEGLWYANNDPHFTWSASDPGSGVAGYSWVLDGFSGTVPDSVVEGSAAQAAFTDLADGVWYLHLRAVDQAGSCSSTLHRRIAVDTTAPVMTGLSSPSHPDEAFWSRDADVSLQWQAADALAGVAGYSWTLDHSPATLPDTTVDGAGPGTVAAGVATGEWYAHVRCRDAAGNWSAALHRRIRVDTAPPVTTPSLSPAPNAAGWSKAPVTVALSATDVGSSVAGTSWRLGDSGDFTPYDAAAKPLVSANGVRRVWYASADVAGNSETPKSVTVRVDTTPPATKALANASVYRGKRVTLRLRVNDAVSTKATVTVRIYKRSVLKKTLKLGLRATNVEIRYSSYTCWLTRGSYTWKVYATDLAGNPQASIAYRTLTVR